MPRSKKRLVDEPRDPRVDGEPLVAQAAVQDGGQQRVREPDDPLVPLEHLRGQRRLERGRTDPRPLEQVRRGRAQRREERERAAGRRGKPREPLVDDLLERLGNRQRLRRVGVGVDDPRQLEGEERVPARPLVDAQQRLAGEGTVEPGRRNRWIASTPERRDRRAVGRAPGRAHARAPRAVRIAVRAGGAAGTRRRASAGRTRARAPTVGRATGGRRSRRAPALARPVPRARSWSRARPRADRWRRRPALRGAA